MCIFSVNLILAGQLFLRGRCVMTHIAVQLQIGSDCFALRETRPATMASSSTAASDSTGLIEKKEDQSPNEKKEDQASIEKKEDEAPNEPIEVEEEVAVKYVYDFIHVPVRSSLATVSLPTMGDPRWKKLGATQVKRIEEEDHMVLYISQMGASYPYKFCEQAPEGNMWRYTRRDQVDLVIKRTVEGNIVPGSWFISLHVYMCVGWFVMNMIAIATCLSSWSTDTGLFGFGRNTYMIHDEVFGKASAARFCDTPTQYRCPLGKFMFTWSNNCHA